MSTHRCTGDQQECEYAAICEDCGVSATPENPVNITITDELPVFICEKCGDF